VKIIMEPGTTEKAAWSLLIGTKIFGIVEPQSSALHLFYAILISISTICLGARVIFSSYNELAEKNSTLIVMNLIYEVCNNS